MFVTELVLPFEFVASHSLDTREEPHPHVWKGELRIEGNAVKGRVIDLPTAENALKQILKRIENTYLNTNALFSAETRAFPTCETLSQDLYGMVDRECVMPARDENPSLRLLSVRIDLYETDGKFYGGAISRRTRT